MKIRIENFQSIGEADIEAEGLTVLVGRSNLGKSALIRAVEGALFNRPGEDFVRTGKLAARVTLTDLPTNDGTAVLTVRWDKGHNLNRFTVDGDEYSKVGQAAPPPLVDAGYRDVKVGAETLRPQVGGQFDPLFLLTKPGSFVSDVLTLISRLGVLLTADRSCAKDLKAAKQLLIVRQADAAAAEQKLEAVQPIVGLDERVQALRPMVDTARALQERVALVRSLVRERQRLLLVAGRALPPVAKVPADLGVRYQQGVALALRRKLLLPIVDLRLAEPTEVPEALGEREVFLRAMVPFRAALVKLAGRKLPPEPATLNLLEKIEENRRLAGAVRAFYVARVAAVNAHDDALRHVKSTRQELEMAEADLSMARAALKVCPVCDRPMEVAGV